MAMRLLIAAALAAYSMSPARAQPVLTSELPLLSDRTAPPLMTQSLGTACNVIAGSKASLPCNPANAYIESFEDGPSYVLSGRLFVGGEYERFKTVNQLLNGPYDEEFVQSLFAENQIIDTQLAGSLGLRTRYFSAAFTPYHLSYVSVVRNQAYPVVALRAAQERSLRAQVAGPVTPWLQAGLQTRLVERKFVQNEFSMFDAIADGQKVLVPKEQRLVYLEPGVSFFGAGTWAPKASVLLTNMGFADRQHEETKQAPVIDTGVGVAPPLGFGVLEVGLNYRASDMRPNIWDRFGFGAGYRLGLIETTLGWGNEQVNLGLMSSFWSAHVAVLFSSKRYRTDDLRDEYRSSVMTEFSFDF